MRDRLWANDCYRLPPSHTPSDQFRSYQPSTHRGRAFRDICYSTFLDSTPLTLTRAMQALTATYTTLQKRSQCKCRCTRC
jgi:hypothetical protein